MQPAHGVSLQSRHLGRRHFAGLGLLRFRAQNLIEHFQPTFRLRGQRDRLKSSVPLVQGRSTVGRRIRRIQRARRMYGRKHLDVQTRCSAKNSRLPAGSPPINIDHSASSARFAQAEILVKLTPVFAGRQHPENRPIRSLSRHSENRSNRQENTFRFSSPLLFANPYFPGVWRLLFRSLSVAFWGRFRYNFPWRSGPFPSAKNRMSSPLRAGESASQALPVRLAAGGRILAPLARPRRGNPIAKTVNVLTLWSDKRPVPWSVLEQAGPLKGSGGSEWELIRSHTFVNW